MKNNSFPLSLRHKAEDESAALPALRAAAERAVTDMLHGEHRQRKTGSGERFWQFREYREGDRPQDIDWKQSAKANRIYVREKEWQTPQSVFLWCSRAASMDFTSSPAHPSKKEAASVLTLALALLLTRAEEHIGFWGQGRTGRSEAALQNLAEILIGGDTRRDTGAEDQALPSVKGGNGSRDFSLILTGDFLSTPSSIEHHFEMLSARTAGGFVIQTLDPAEIELPYQGRILFEGPPDIRELVDNTASIRAAYQERIETHIATVKQAAQKNRFHYLLHRTDGPFADTLLKVWSIMNPLGYKPGGGAL
ncbi:MAG: DUF58 domain-containing protein [Alphaproteobacteria bacterium]|nr:DUF58 domain-containing protein [Alphaproteobacteria bacterium]